MCRSIKVLRGREEPPTSGEVSAAALQFVRKISGFHKPSKANQAAFERAVQEITQSSERLLTAIAKPRTADPRRERVSSRDRLLAQDDPNLSESL